MRRNNLSKDGKDMTLKEIQFLIKYIEKGSLEKVQDNRSEAEKKENSQRLVLKLIEEFGELAENIRKNLRYKGDNIKGTIEEELFDIFYYIIAIANDYNIDLEEIFHIKDKINKEKYERSFSLEEARKEYEKIHCKVIMDRYSNYFYFVGIACCWKVYIYYSSVLFFSQDASSCTFGT